MDRRARIEEKLREALDARHVEIEDESHLHAGHEPRCSGRPLAEGGLHLGHRGDRRRHSEHPAEHHRRAHPGTAP